MKKELCVVIPISVIRLLGDVETAAFLEWAVFLSRLRGVKHGYWFFLRQVGDPSGESLWRSLGSWQYLLGLSQDQQLAIRRRIHRIAPGLLCEQVTGTPGRLFYRVAPEQYEKFRRRSLRG